MGATVVAGRNNRAGDRAAGNPPDQQPPAPPGAHARATTVVFQEGRGSASRGRVGDGDHLRPHLGERLRGDGRRHSPPPATVAAGLRGAQCAGSGAAVVGQGRQAGEAGTLGSGDG